MRTSYLQSSAAVLSTCIAHDSSACSCLRHAHHTAALLAGGSASSQLSCSILSWPITEPVPSAAVPYAGRGSA